MGPEAKIEKKICDYARKNGWLTWKFVSPGSKGVPDRIFMSPTGKVVFMEMKAPGGKLTDLQQWEITRINMQGGCAVWAASVEDGVRLIDYYSSPK